MGIEIYKGKPIFYSLGELIMQSEGVQSFPAHAYERFGLSLEASPADFLDARSGNDTKGFIASPIYWESVIADCQFDDGRLAAVRLHPIELGYRKPRPQRGRPMMAEGEIANQIVSRLERLSLPFGTRLERTHDGAQVALEVAVA